MFCVAGGGGAPEAGEAEGLWAFPPPGLPDDGAAVCAPPHCTALIPLTPCSALSSGYGDGERAFVERVVGGKESEPT